MCVVLWQFITPSANVQKRVANARTQHTRAFLRFFVFFSTFGFAYVPRVCSECGSKQSLNAK